MYRNVKDDDKDPIQNISNRCRHIQPSAHQAIMIPVTSKQHFHVQWEFHTQACNTVYCDIAHHHPVGFWWRWFSYRSRSFLLFHRLRSISRRSTGRQWRADGQGRGDTAGKRAINGVPGIQSTLLPDAGNDGEASIQVVFNSGVDPNIASSISKTGVASVINKLPPLLCGKAKITPRRVQHAHVCEPVQHRSGPG